MKNKKVLLGVLIAVIVVITIIVIIATQSSSVINKSFRVEKNKDGTVSITAQGAGENSFGIEYITLAAGQNLEVTTDLAEGSSIKIEVVSKSNEEDVYLEEAFSSVDMREFELPAGDYMIRATVEKESTGSIDIKTNENGTVVQTASDVKNIPLKDDLEEAKYQIEVAMQYKLEEIYGNKVFDARVNVEKIYSREEENQEPLNSYGIGPNDLAFEVRYEIKPANGADITELLVPNGEYDEGTGWIKDKYSVGILRQNDGGEQKYIITDFGTGW